MARRSGPEAGLQKGALQLLRTVHGVYCWRNNTGSWKVGDRYVKFGLKGSSDILGVLGPHGRFLAVELKAQGEKPTPEQRVFLEAVRALGGVAVWVDRLSVLQKVMETLHASPEAEFAIDGTLVRGY